MQPSADNPMELDAEVLIAGAGPVGLSVALALARQGVSCQLFEALPSLSDEARASTFHPPTLELFAQWGVVDAVLAHGLRVTRLQYWERETRALVADLSYERIAADTPYPFRLQCPQSVVTRLLLPALRETGRAQVHFSHRAVRCSQDAGGVRLQVEGPEGLREVRGRYLVAADGARSALREFLQVPFPGFTYEDRFLLVASDLALERWFPGLGPVAYIFDPREWVIVMRQPDRLRTVFRLDPGADADEALQPSHVRARMQGFIGEEVPWTLHSVSLYRVHQRVADRFRLGRVLLTGDAAHINNPTGGMGMNSGIHDAALLASALYPALRAGDEAGLDHYAEVRRNAAIALVQQHTAQRYQDLSTEDQAQRQRRDQALRAAAADPVLERAYLLRASMLEDRI